LDNTRSFPSGCILGLWKVWESVICLELKHCSAMSSTLETPLRYSSTIQSPRSPPNSRLGSIRAGVHGLFSGQSTVERARSHSVDTPESPKTPRPVFPRPVVGLQNLPSPRLHIPYLTRSRSQRSARSHHSNNSQSSITPLSPRVPFSLSFHLVLTQLTRALLDQDRQICDRHYDGFEAVRQKH